MCQGCVRGVIGHIRREVMGSIREVLGPEGEVKGKNRRYGWLTLAAFGGRFARLTTSPAIQRGGIWAVVGVRI